MLPIIRPRRIRKHKWIRDLVAQEQLLVQDLIYPLFITSGSNITSPINKMPGVFVYSIDKLLDEISKSINQGILAIALFPQIDNEFKTLDAHHSYSDDNLVCKAVRAIKQKFSDQVGVICDVALDPYTLHGHDGVLNTEMSDVDNDATLEILGKQALSLSRNGADFVAPSDMMDGRIRYIRSALDQNSFANIGIISYAAKYASKLYGPFRQAIGSKKIGESINKESYQMDIRNSKEALQEIELDVEESADIILIKPAIHSLDIIANTSSSIKIPVFAYQVSGEYVMNYLYSSSCDISFESVIIESLTCIKRSGARAIFSYAAPLVANFLKSNNRL